MARARTGKPGAVEPIKKPKDRDELIQRLRAKLPELRRSNGVHSLDLFGSYVCGEARHRSDVDLPVEFDRTPSLFKFIELEQQLSDLLRVKADLV